MKIINKIATVLLSIISVFTLVSCEGLFGGGGGEQLPVNSAKDFKKLIYVDDDLDIVTIRSKITEYTGMIPFTKDTEAESDGELVFGNTNRAITAAAKAELAKQLENSADCDIGYIIYKQGKNLAVYWDDAGMMDIAVSKFINICVSSRHLELDDGVIAFVGYDSAEYERDKYWLALDAVADDDVVSAFKSIYNYMDGGKIADFFANLWDGEVGGFYYTAGARDNVGFLPDLESTYQVIKSLQTNGAISDVNAAFPTEIKEKIVNFAKSTQSATDGYFYHSQWAQDKSLLQTDRYGRDMGHATSIISSFMLDTDGDGQEEIQYPNYCAPNGIKCALHTGTDEKCSFPIATAYYTQNFDNAVSTTLTSSVSAAVSKVSSSTVTAVASVSSHPDYSSSEAFSAWLEAYNANIKEASGYAHNLSAIRSEITQHGYEQIVLDYLDRVQKEVYEDQLANNEEPTGLWQYNVNYKAIWGFLKYSGYYNSADKGRAIGKEYIPYIAKTFVKVISLPADGEYHSNDLYNQWEGVRRLISNASKYYGDELVEEIRNILRDNAAELIENSLEKIKSLNRGNGTFSYSSNGTSPATIYGTPISPGIVEGNVNSTDIITQMYCSIYYALGYNPVPLMTSSDGERFINTICTIGNVVKNEIKVETIDFESGKLPTGFSYNSSDATFSCEIAEDPEDSSNSALYISSTSTGGTDILFPSVGTSSKCYIFESDIYISSDTSSNNNSGEADIAQIKLGNASNSSSKEIAYMIVLRKTANGVNILEKTTTGSDSLSNLITSAGLDKWFTLRVEYYTVEEDSDDVPHAKVWLNEELVYTSDNVYFGLTQTSSDATPFLGYERLNIRLLKDPTVCMYLDNCFFSRENKDFDANDTDITDSRDQ